MTELAISLKQSTHKKKRNCIIAMLILSFITFALLCLCLYLGNTIYSMKTILRVLLGEDISGASYTITNVRLPRTLAGVFAGFAFGVAGFVFQSMLRNPLASPDIIGITSGSSVAAVFSLLVLGTTGTFASAFSVLGGVSVTVIIFLLASRNGFSNGRMILIGIGVQAMLKAIVSFIILKASTFDVPVALRWLTGSLNGATQNNIPFMAIVISVSVLAILFFESQLKIIELGDESAISLGVGVNKIRALMSICSVIMLSFAIAVTGPIASVAFLAGPISVRITGKNNANIIASGFVGVIIVLASDLVGQHLLGTRFPVGVITGLLGTPYLLYLLISLNRQTTL